MRPLGKSLQASHERQMVRMAKLLHSLETLAEEAEKEERQRQRQKQRNDAGNAENDEDAPPAAASDRDKPPSGGDNGEAPPLRMTNLEIPGLRASPELAWEHIRSLKNGATYGREDVKRILRAAQEALRGEPSLIDLSERCRRGREQDASSREVASDGASEEGGALKMVTVVGDLHGHFEDSLLKVLDMVDARTVGEGNGSPWDGTGAVVFNGGERYGGWDSIGFVDLHHDTERHKII